MFVQWLSAVAISILILSCSLSMQGSSLQRVKMRDLSRYDEAGSYTIELDLDAKARANIEAEVREFLWNHWHKRRLGHATITHYSKEGEPSTSSYFVEPDARGIWHIAVKIDRTLVDRRGSKSQYYETVEYDAYFVERIEVPKDGLTQRVVIPEAEVRSSTAYRLVLKDQERKPLTEI
jgi:hypothetical protein